VTCFSVRDYGFRFPIAIKHDFSKLYRADNAKEIEPSGQDWDFTSSNPWWTKLEVKYGLILKKDLEQPFMLA
jgi:hypothetical protein